MSKQLIETYINYHKNAWAPCTLKAEQSRLNAVFTNYSAALATPESLYVALLPVMKRYSIKTLFIRLSDFYEWGIKRGLVIQKENYYKTFLIEYANRFKHVYTPKKVDISYIEAQQRIATISNEYGLRNKAVQLLSTGMRFTESYTLKDEHVLGKGEKRRRIFNIPVSTGVTPDVTYWPLYRALKKVGLTPHMLRKLAATQLARTNKFRPEDLCHIFGWSSIQTASIYLQPKKDSELNNLIKESLK